MRQRSSNLTALILLTGLGFVGLGTFVRASTLSPGILEKMTVYQGVVMIVPTSGRAMELGRGGSDITALTDIIFRPSRLAAPAGVRFVRNGNLVDVHISGQLCLDTCVPPWPVGGGTSYWNTIAGPNLVPTDTTWGTVIDAAQNWTDIGSEKTAVNAVSDGVLPTVNITPAAGQPAAVVNGNAYLRGNVYINNPPNSATAVTVDGNKVWYSGNDGRGSGLDADSLLGQPIFFYRPQGGQTLWPGPEDGSSTNCSLSGICICTMRENYEGYYVWWCIDLESTP